MSIQFYLKCKHVKLEKDKLSNFNNISAITKKIEKYL